jgi:hypothetical protein
MMSTDWEMIQEVKRQIADKYTAAELCEILQVDIEDIIEIYWDRINVEELLD